MKLKIVFTVESEITGISVEDIKRKFEAGDSAETDWVTLTEVRDADTGENKMDEWNNIHVDITCKFKPNDWVVSPSGDVYQICDITGASYCLMDTEHQAIVVSIFTVDETYHAWTLTDAKDRDLLYIKDTDSIVCFKTKPKRCVDILCYYGYDGNKKMFVGDEDYWSFEEIYPADNVQVNQLQALKDYYEGCKSSK